jgi:hypothetical protein
MRDLVSFIFANFIPILIAVSFILRIVVGIRNQARKKQPSPVPPVREKEEEEYVSVWSRLMADEEEGEGEDQTRPYGRAPGVSGEIRPPLQQTRPLLMPAPSASVSHPPPLKPALAPLPPAPSALLEPGLTAPEPLAGPESGIGKKAGETGTGESPEKGSAVRAFFRRVDSLPPLGRALVLSEILGPPKGA